MCANLLGLPWYYRLREEARKSWKYCVSDKIVDFNQIRKPDVESRLFVDKPNLHSDIWIELHFTLVGERVILAF